MYQPGKTAVNPHCWRWRKAAAQFAMTSDQILMIRIAMQVCTAPVYQIQSYLPRYLPTTYLGR